MTAHTQYDLIIVGGGMIGASLAHALKNSGLSLALIEACSVASAQQPSYDDRGIALSYGSQRIFEAMELWSSMAQYATAIQHIHVSDRGHFGVTQLSAAEESVPALGQVITARSMGQVLNRVIAEQQNLTLYRPARVVAIHPHHEEATLTLDDDSLLSARLIVAADGAHSTLRQVLSLNALEYDYQQTAITANITPERPHQGRAYERFTASGPLALLPMSEQRCSLVWTVTTDEAPALLAMEEADFLQQLQQRFGYRLGQFKKAGQRHSYPLKLIHMDQPVQQRLVFIGNAAHSVHPIAGQGFNLGLRDVAALAQVIVDYHSDCGHARALHEYRQWRQQDQDSLIRHTHSLVSLFSQSSPLLGHVRGAALTLLDIVPPAKHFLARYSMGLTGRQPRLARGLPL